MSSLPMIMIVISLIFVAVPLSSDPETIMATLPITIGAIIFLLIGELIIKAKKIGK